ncbi:MAG: hypothetical protein ABSA75_05715 [Candidatus Bathyarchaeia archaeon]|jgi:hypothetical protein
MTEQNQKQFNIQNHSEFDDFIAQGLRSGGVHIVASKSHGKSRLMFAIFAELQQQENVRAIAFDGSETWLYSASKVETFTVQERDIVSQDVKSTDEFEKYALKNWNLIELALKTHKDLLFRLKTRKPSKRGYFVRTVVNYLDALQRAEKAESANHENTKAIPILSKRLKTVLALEVLQGLTWKNSCAYSTRHETTGKHSTQRHSV